MGQNRAKPTFSLTKKEIKEFMELIGNIELKDVFVEKEKLEINRNIPISGVVNIELKTKDSNLDIENKTAYVEYLIKLKSNRKKVYEQITKYRVYLILKDEKSVFKTLENANVRGFFIYKQLNKLLWPFLRTDFHNNLARVGIKPFTLPLLR